MRRTVVKSISGSQRNQSDRPRPVRKVNPTRLSAAGFRNRSSHVERRLWRSFPIGCHQRLEEEFSDARNPVKQVDAEGVRHRGLGLPRHHAGHGPTSRRFQSGSRSFASHAAVDRIKAAERQWLYLPAIQYLGVGGAAPRPKDVLLYTDSRIRFAEVSDGLSNSRRRPGRHWLRGSVSKRPRTQSAQNRQRQPVWAELTRVIRMENRSGRAVRVVGLGTC
jgi:hypothetical protein